MRLRRMAVRALLAASTASLALALAGAASAARYVVVYDEKDVPANAARRIDRAGGTLVASYDAIGVLIAESSAASFAASVQRDERVVGVASTSGFELSAQADFAEHEGGPPEALPNAPASDADTFSGLQWSMRQIHAPEGHALTGGSPAVVVGHIDTGLDATHPDLAPNVDFANSVSCVGGAPNPAPAAWDDDSGHGTHTAGVIAAAANGIGVVGGAPNVKIAAIKASVRVGTTDLFLPDAVICAFMWAGSRHLDVTNNSYSVDSALVNPVTFFCRDDPAQRTMLKAVRRSVRYAMHKGVTVVASAGNSNLDLANPPVGNECVRLPSELPGVITVSANGLFEQKASYSNYGLGVIDLVAPGGDLAQGTPPSGLVLSTWPAKFQVPRLLCSPCPGPGSPPAYYRYAFGTSQAAAHVSAVAALVVSRFGDGDSPQNGKMRPRRVQALLERTADSKPCPPAPSTCQGDLEYNGYFGHGQVNALRAILRDTSSD